MFERPKARKTICLREKICSAKTTFENVLTKVADFGGSMIQQPAVCILSRPGEELQLLGYVRPFPKVRKLYNVHFNNYSHLWAVRFLPMSKGFKVLMLKIIFLTCVPQKLSADGEGMKQPRKGTGEY
jgi:hypothetical protein